VDDFLIVAIRRYARKDEESIKYIIRSSHENIVSLQECFVSTDCLYFVYEYIEISLAEIQATPCGALEAYYTAVICQKVKHFLWSALPGEAKITHVRWYTAFSTSTTSSKSCTAQSMHAASWETGQYVSR